MAFCQVIVDIAHEDVDRVFTYRVPEGMSLCPGMRVHVPFGRIRRVEGVVVEMADDCDLPPERVRDVADTLEDYPAILPALLALWLRGDIRLRDTQVLTNVGNRALFGESLFAMAPTRTTKEAVAAVRGEATPQEAVAAIQLASRRYAKRQLTWLRRDQDLFWLRHEKTPDMDRACRLSTQFLSGRGIE